MYLAAVGNDVGGASARHGADVERDERHAGKQFAVGRPLGLELAAQHGQRDDGAGGGLDGAPAQMGIARVRRLPCELEPEADHALVRAHDAKRRGLADDHLPGQPRDRRERLGEAARAQGSDFLVVGEQQRERPPKRRRVGRREPVGRERQKPLHVRRSPPDVPVARLGQGERIGPPLCGGGGPLWRAGGGRRVRAPPSAGAAVHLRRGSRAPWAPGISPRATRTPRSCRGSVVVGEPTELRVVRAHKGMVRLRLDFAGPGGALGVSAPGPERDRARGPRHRRAGGRSGAPWRPSVPPTRDGFPAVPFAALNVGTVAGGSAANVIPDRCEVQLSIRLLPGMTADAMAERVRRRRPASGRRAVRAGAREREPRDDPRAGGADPSRAVRGGGTARLPQRHVRLGRRLAPARRVRVRPLRARAASRWRTSRTSPCPWRVPPRRRDARRADPAELRA